MQRKTKMEVRRKERNGSDWLERRGSSKQKLIDTVDSIDDWPTLRYNGTRSKGVVVQVQSEGVYMVEKLEERYVSCQICKCQQLIWHW